MLKLIIIYMVSAEPVQPHQENAPTSPTETAKTFLTSVNSSPERIEQIERQYASFPGFTKVDKMIEFGALNNARDYLASEYGPDVLNTRLAIDILAETAANQLELAKRSTDAYPNEIKEQEALATSFRELSYEMKDTKSDQ